MLSGCVNSVPGSFLGKYAVSRWLGTCSFPILPPEVRRTVSRHIQRMLCTVSCDPGHRGHLRLTCAVICPLLEWFLSTVLSTFGILFIERVKSIQVSYSNHFAMGLQAHALWLKQRVLENSLWLNERNCRMKMKVKMNS